MPKITLPTLPTNDSPLLSSPDVSSIQEAYTQATYAAYSLPDIDSGIMSTANGRLTVKNLSPAFEVKAEHIQPEQASLARQDSMTASSTIFGNGCVDPVIGVQTGEKFFPLPGCSVRWYQPYATSMSLMQWSFFVSYNCWRGAYKNLSQVLQDNVNTPIVIRCKLDGSHISGNDRYLAQNMFHPLSPGAVDGTNTVGAGANPYNKTFKEMKGEGRPSLADLSVEPVGDKSVIPYNEDAPGLYGGNPQYVQTEGHSALHFDLHHMDALSKGFHEISLECSIGTPDDDGVLVMNKGNKQSGPLRGQGYFNLVGKLSLGIRNARVLNLL